MPLNFTDLVFDRVSVLKLDMTELVEVRDMNVSSLFFSFPCPFILILFGNFVNIFNQNVCSIINYRYCSLRTRACFRLECFNSGGGYG